jgi:hypothetical protein
MNAKQGNINNNNVNNTPPSNHAKGTNNESTITKDLKASQLQLLKNIKDNIDQLETDKMVSHIIIK